MPEKTKIHCPDCGCELVKLSNGEYFCGKCKETRTLIVDVLEHQEKDDLPKFIKFLLILITLGLVIWTIVLLIRGILLPVAVKKAAEIGVGLAAYLHELPPLAPPEMAAML
ncbi:MAG: TFIIB-type zinc finger domain-containing protein [Oscillospiraceae bacterium]|nr:TFIIB-type zinc finger domain-containing protein [Oscillospiraceae bacterium]